MLIQNLHKAANSFREAHPGMGNPEREQSHTFAKQLSGERRLGVRGARKQKSQCRECVAELLVLNQPFGGGSEGHFARMGKLEIVGIDNFGCELAFQIGNEVETEIRILADTDGCFSGENFLSLEAHPYLAYEVCCTIEPGDLIHLHTVKIGMAHHEL